MPPPTNNPRLSAYHDQMLSAREMNEMAQVLETQPDTRKAYDAMARLVSQLRRLPPPQAPAGFWNDAIDRLRQYAEEQLRHDSSYAALVKPSRHYQRSMARQLDEFSELLKEHDRRLYGVAYRLTGSHDDAQDLIQTALCEALRNYYRFEPGTRFDRWMFRIMRNRWIDAVRHRSLLDTVSLERPGAEPGEAVTWEPPDPDADPGTEVLENVLDEQIQRALAALAPEYRQAVVLVDLHELSYEEAATAMHCPVGTVRSRLHRGRMLLREALSPPGDSSVA